MTERTPDGEAKPVERLGSETISEAIGEAISDSQAAAIAEAQGDPGRLVVDSPEGPVPADGRPWNRRGLA